jgi:galactokinase
MTIENLKENFVKRFGEGGDIRGYFAPGRVNLIGEHIDYNGGHVFPCALTVGNYVIARKRTDRKVCFFSENYRKGGIIERSLDNLTYDDKKGWTNYPFGVIWAFDKRGMKLDCGLDVYVWGNIPGSGLSSSAAMEVVIGNMLKDFYGFNVSSTEIALIGQYSENNFNGCNCGIMDQFASAMGQKDQAIFLDCSDLSFEYVPLVLKGCKIIVSNSNKPHSLVSSHYNERRAECEKAVEELSSLNIQHLCELTPEQFEENKHLIKDDLRRARAKHAVYEEQRTKDAIVALKNNDLVKFGQLLNESGDSLRYDYDATCFEIDVLVDEARKQKGVYGSRETGGGWGGNTVSIVEDAYVEDFKKNVGKVYQEKTGLTATFATLEVGEGGRRLF